MTAIDTVGAANRSRPADQPADHEQLIVAGCAAAEWPVIGTTARVVVTKPDALPAARAIVVEELAALDAACSRFRPDSEIVRVQAAGGRPVQVSALLAETVDVALDAARRTKGDVDPTVGAALVDLGYDRDIGAVRIGPASVPVRVASRVPGWGRVRLDRDRRILTVPAGTLLDLGATAKAWAADRCAGRIATELRCGVLVGLGGDLATAGAAPTGGWRVRVQDRPDRYDDPTACAVTLPAGVALATSSTGSRTWRRAGRVLHHIVDPRTARPAPVVWGYVTVAADTCLAANTASTAALIRGRTAPGWLATLGLTARLVAADGTVSTTCGWPREAPS